MSDITYAYPLILNKVTYYAPRLPARAGLGATEGRTVSGDDQNRLDPIGRQVIEFLTEECGGLAVRLWIGGCKVACTAPYQREWMIDPNRAKAFVKGVPVGAAPVGELKGSFETDPEVVARAALHSRDVEAGSSQRGQELVGITLCDGVNEAEADPRKLVLDPNEGLHDEDRRLDALTRRVAHATSTPRMHEGTGHVRH